jgi:hypothetical protein
MDNPQSAIVTTAGVTSQVYENGDVMGHVALLDLDDEPLIEAVKVADHLDAVAAVLRSSDGSHHIWGLHIDELREQTLCALSYNAVDDSHVGASWRRGYGVLRVTAKVRENGEAYKRRPTVVHVSPSGADGPHSGAHAAMLRTLMEEQGDEPRGDWGVLKPSQSAVEYVGDDDLRLDHYQTLTDAGKSELGGEA